VSKIYTVGRSRHLNKEATLENAFANTRAGYLIWKLNVLVLFPPVPCLKRPRVIGDVLIAVWIAIQTKKHLHRPAPFIIGHPCYWFSYIFGICKIRLVDFKKNIK
jgi:hypothetical protein